VVIQDTTRTQKPTPRDWAVFRYGLISEATRPLAGEVVSDILARVAAHQHTLPDGSVRRFSVATLRSWLATYRREGLDGLVPRIRSDKGTFRVLSDDTQELIARHRVQHRALSVKLFHEVLLHDGVLPPGVTVRLGTLRRFLKSRGLDKPVRGPGKARAKYEMPHPNDLWVGDYMHGPRVLTSSGKRKAILCAIIDDHSRVVTGARFSFTEDTADILHTLRDAIATYGVAKRFYCDNGPAFVSRLLAEACARIGTTLLHSEPFDSPSRGKIERFFRTVRARFLPLLIDADLSSLQALSERFERWLRDDYHLRRHGGIDMKPLDRFLAGAESTVIQRLAPQEIDHAFMARITRVVRQDATVKIDSVFYEVPPEFIGARVDIRYPVADPRQLFLYRDDHPVSPIRPVDLADNARFHARTVDTSYSQFAPGESSSQGGTT
jgi:transposase InsO family protein